MTKHQPQHQYLRCDEKDIPGNVSFHVPDRLRGQTVEVSYGGFGKECFDEGAPFKKVHDRSEYGATYYRLAKRADETLLEAIELAEGHLAEATKLKNAPARQVWRMALKQLRAPEGAPLAEGQRALAEDIVRQSREEE